MVDIKKNNDMIYNIENVDVKGLIDFFIIL